MTVVAPRAVIVTRPTEYELLLGRHGTRAQAEFFLKTRGQTLGAVEARHARVRHAVSVVDGAIPREWRRVHVPRADLDRFLFEPGDVLVAVGQDGLVANLAKYTSGQPVIGVNPDPETYDGILVRHPARATPELLVRAHAGTATVESRTMVHAALDDGQRFMALNEVFAGHRSHQSARYRIAFRGQEERQSSSGTIVATGTGSTGWARSIARERGARFGLPGPCDPSLSFFVREAFPSVSTGTRITAGVLDAGDELVITSEMDDGGVLFGDGIESDAVAFPWGMRASLRVAETQLRLVV